MHGLDVKGRCPTTTAVECLFGPILVHYRAPPWRAEHLRELAVAMGNRAELRHDRCPSVNRA